MKNPWEQQPKESEEAYHAFKIYLELPYPRRLRAVAEAEDKSYQLMRIWSMRNNWAERVRLYDNFYNREQMQKVHDTLSDALAQARIDVLRQEWEDSQMMRDNWLELYQEVVSSEESTVEDMAKLVRIRSSIDDFQRRTLRMPLTYSAKELPASDEEADDQPLLVDWNGIVERPLLAESEET